MRKKTKKDRKPRPQPRPNRQIAISQIRKMAEVIVRPELQHAREYPLVGCWIMAGWQESGIAPVIVAREQEPGRVMFGDYMVDLYCLGIKDVFIRTDYSLARFERELEKLCPGQPIKCSVELAHEVIYGALEYAERLGFQPHPDFKAQAADLMLDPPDAHRRVDQVVFGKNGKPFFVAGPYDDERKTMAILKTLNDSVGEGNFEFLAEIEGIEDLFDEDYLDEIEDDGII
jgi:hypothetical protein